MGTYTSGSSSSTRRRSGRLPVRVKVRLAGTNAQSQDFEERSETIEVSKYGAKVALHHELKVGSVLTLERPEADRNARFKVVYQSSPEAGSGQRETGIEFVGVDSFWGIEFPPDRSQWS
jgi:PilZ domain